MSVNFWVAHDDFFDFNYAFVGSFFRELYGAKSAGTEAAK